jgi:hypothetical protein
MLLRPVTIFNDPIELNETTRYLKVILDKKLTRSLNINYVRTKNVQMMGMLVSLLNRKSNLSFRNGPCYINIPSAIYWIRRAPRCAPRLARTSGGYRCYNPSVSDFLLVPAISKLKVHTRGSA